MNNTTLEKKGSESAISITGLFFAKYSGQYNTQSRRRAQLGGLFNCNSMAKGKRLYKKKKADWT